MAFALVTHTKKAAGTTDAIDTTGADLIIGLVAVYAGGGGGAFSDSKGNTWTGLTAQSESGLSWVRIYYCVNPTVGSGHTFSVSGSYQTLCVAAFSGAKATGTFDQQSGSSSGTSGAATPGSITPSENDCLFVTGLGTFYAGISGAPSGFTASDYFASDPGGCSTGLAYEIQTTATARNPSWSYTGSYGWSCVAAVFKAAAGGGGGGTKVFIPAFCRGGNG